MIRKFINNLRKLKSKFSKPKSKLDSYLREVSGVIHIGANIGQERKQYARLGLDVVWVEPIPEVFAELEKNIAPLERQRAFRYILTDRDGDDIKLNISNNKGEASSILDIGELKKIWPDVHYTGVVKLKSSTFKTFVRTEGISLNAYDALVMDTQGSELMVLKGAGDMLQNFRFIYTEAADFEAYVGCCQADDLSAFLSDYGFREIARKPFAENAEGGCYYDILYAR